MIYVEDYCVAGDKEGIVNYVKRDWMHEKGVKEWNFILKKRGYCIRHWFICVRGSIHIQGRS